MRHSSAPESMSAPTVRVSRPQDRETGNRLFGLAGGEEMFARLTRTPPLASQIFWANGAGADLMPLAAAVETQPLPEALLSDPGGQS